MKIKALFIGLRKRRAEAITSAIEAASSLVLDVVTATGLSGVDLSDLKDYGVVFVDRETRETQLVKILDAITDFDPEIPIVLIYKSSPDGKAFMIANQYDCLLFSEMDTLGRTLTARELAEALRYRSPETDHLRKLMELSMSCGPCSTGE